VSGRNTPVEIKQQDEPKRGNKERSRFLPPRNIDNSYELRVRINSAANY